MDFFSDKAKCWRIPSQEEQEAEIRRITAKASPGTTVRPVRSVDDVIDHQLTRMSLATGLSKGQLTGVPSDFHRTSIPPRVRATARGDQRYEITVKHDKGESKVYMVASNLTEVKRLLKKRVEYYVLDIRAMGTPQPLEMNSIRDFLLNAEKAQAMAKLKVGA